MKTILERANARGHAHHGALDTFYSFSYGDYHNPSRLNFGMLQAVNDNTLSPLETVVLHPQKNMEIISLPLTGSLHHQDSLGNKEMIRWGQIQVLSTGRGVEYSDYNDSSSKIPSNFLQIMFLPDELNVQPAFEIFDIMPALREGQLCPIVAPDGTAPAMLKQNIRLSIGLLHHGFSAEYKLHGPDMGVFAFLLGGHADVADFDLNPRDSLCISDTDSFRIEAVKNTTLLLIEVPL